MAGLSLKTRRKIIKLLEPLMGTTEERRALLYLAFGNSPVIDGIKCDGSTMSFVPNLVKNLEEYGESEPDKQALWALLEIVSERVGVNKQKQIAELHSEIESLSFSIQRQFRQEPELLPGEISTVETLPPIDQGENQQILLGKTAELRKWRVLMAGGSRILDKNAKFCKKLGSELVREHGVVVVTGGFRYLKNSPSTPSADWSSVKGALSRLRAKNVESTEQIETLIPDQDRPEIVRFYEGNTIILKNCNPQSRRFMMVNSVDVIVALEGRKGTKEIIDLALALGKPVFPLPFCHGISAKRWYKNKHVVQSWFNLDDAAVTDLESINLEFMSEDSMSELAKKIVDYLFNVFQKKRRKTSHYELRMK